MPHDFSCLDWQDRIKSGRSLVPRLPLDRDEAARAVEFYNMLPIPDIPGTPRLGDAGGAWFQEIVENLFGSFNATTGVRFIRELFLLVPKKNSKTTSAAALMLTALVRNRRPRAEFLLVAPTQAVTKIAFGQAVGMIEACPELLNSKLFHIQGHLSLITFLPTGSTLQIKSFDPKIMTGVKPSGILLDEIHVIATSPEADRVIGQMRGGIVSQPEAFFAMITTQSERPPSGVFRSELLKARGVRDGDIRLRNAQTLAVLYEFPPDVDWRDSSNWWMVTPNNGRSISVDRLIPDYEGAIVAGEEELRRWASQHLNIEIGLGLRSDRWVGAEYWEAAVDSEITSLDDILSRCDLVICGIDGGGLEDLLGLNILGREKKTRRWLSWSHAWAHRSVLERRQKEAPALLDFAAEGDLTIVEKVGDDVAQLVEYVSLVFEAGLLSEVAIDPMGVGMIVDALALIGVAGDEMIIGVSQGYKLQGSIKTAERKLADGSLVHVQSRMMNWVLGNAKTEPKGNAVMITKQAAGGKIDPLMAFFNSVSRMSAKTDEILGPSVYEEVAEKAKATAEVEPHSPAVSVYQRIAAQKPFKSDELSERHWGEV